MKGKKCYLRYSPKTKRAFLLTPQGEMHIQGDLNDKRFNRQSVKSIVCLFGFVCGKWKEVCFSIITGSKVTIEKEFICSARPEKNFCKIKNIIRLDKKDEGKYAGSAKQI